MIFYLLIMFSGIILFLIFGRKRNKFLFAVSVILMVVGLIFSVATWLLVSAVN